MSNRIIAIGDIHGCSVALDALTAALQLTPDDTVVTLGDYVNRGPDSCGVLDRLIALQGRCNLVPLLGNHEEMLLYSLRDRNFLKTWQESGGVEMLASYHFDLETAPPWRSWNDAIPRDHWAFLTRCRNYYETDTHLFVHANYDPNLPMDQQPMDVLRWKHLDRAKALPHFSGKRAVVGHTQQRNGEVLDLGFLVCIDTTCYKGLWLTALDVTTGQTWQANQRGELQARSLPAATGPG